MFEECFADGACVPVKNEYCKRAEAGYRDLVTGKYQRVLRIQCRDERSESGRCGKDGRFFELRHAWLRDTALWGLFAQLALGFSMAAVCFYLFGVAFGTMLGFRVPVNPWHWFF